MRLSGLVLAGGGSRRMGRDKATLEWHGVPLVDRVASTLAVVCDEVLIASGDGRRLGRPGEIADAVADAGPLAGLLAGLEAAAHPLVAVVAVDMPYASAAVLRALAEAMGELDAAVPVVEDRLQPLHAVYRTACAPALRAYLEEGGRSVGGFVGELRVALLGREVWGGADPEGAFAINVNRPEDLDES